MANSIQNYITWSKEKWAHTGFQKYLRNTGWMFGGQISTALSLVVNIWTARYLGPTQYGNLSYILAFVGIFSFIANFGLSEVLIRDLVRYPEKKNILLGTAARLLTFAGVGAFFISAISALLFETSPFLRILIILYSTIFIWSPFNVISAYFQATVQAKKNAFAQIVGVFLVSFLKIYLILTAKGIIWFTLAFTFDYIIGALLLVMNYYQSNLDFKKWSFDKNIAKGFLASSYLLMLSAAAGYILLKIDQVMVKFYLDETAVGLYAIAVKLSEAWYFIPGIVTTSLFPAIINAKKTSTTLYHSRLFKLFLFLILAAITVAIPVSLFSKTIITLLYGVSYLPSTQLLQIYVWSGVGLFLTIGLNKYFLTEGKLKSIFYYSLLSVTTNILLNIVLIPKIGLTGAAWSTLISYSIGPIFFFSVHKLFIKNYEK